ncbi:MAG TPA: type II secretion system F family protein [Solirubrobacterales bacterium]|nr:type II secretion system F family protein [Solirubrobacterales bacterium]
MIAALIALAVLLGAGALWELAGSRGEAVGVRLRGVAAALSGGRVRTMAGAALWLRIPQRLRRAGLAERVPVAAVLAAKMGGVVVGALLAGIASPALPGRLAVMFALVLPAAGFVAPEALLERYARRRRARIGTALPDVLDLLAVGTAAGRSPATVLGEISSRGDGPLARELAVAVAEIGCGVPQREAIAAVRERVFGSELGALTSALERSRRYGSPLAEQLHEQAASLRTAGRRRISEHAARAAPKIQLVVALVLVPSVLLMILAALIAHSAALLGPL